MRLDLEGLDAKGVELAFDTDASHPRRVSLGRTQKLSGMLTKTEGSLLLTDVQAEAIVVSLLELALSSFSVQLGAEGALRGLMGGYRREEGASDIDVVAAALDAPELSLRFSRFSVKGRLRGENVALRISGSEGQLEASGVVLEGVEFKDNFSGQAERVVGQDLRVSWGADGYRVTLRSLELDAARVDLDLTKKSESDEDQEDVEGRSPLPPFDWRTLDGLSGALDVDVHVNMKVPVIVSRRAKHPFRIQIQGGTVNYMDLERSLSALEESILDFAVRDGNLVLERGLPLIPTRGRGKPLVLWALDERDLALTSEDRVRLAVLPKYQRAEEESSGEEQGDSSVSLEELSFVDLQALLRLAPQEIPGTASPIRTLGFEELQLQGTVHHGAEKEPREGAATGKLRGLTGAIAGLFLGESQLDVAKLTLDELLDLRASFLDVRPEKVNLSLSGLRLESISFGNLVEPPEGVPGS